MDKKEAIRKSELRNHRASRINALKVTVDGLTFSADELSQERMVRSVLTMSLNETTKWILANDSVADVTRAQLLAALKQARIEQTNIWMDTKG